MGHSHRRKIEMWKRHHKRLCILTLQIARNFVKLYTNTRVEIVLAAVSPPVGADGEYGVGGGTRGVER